MEKISNSERSMVRVREEREIKSSFNCFFPRSSSLSIILSFQLSSSLTQLSFSPFPRNLLYSPLICSFTRRLPPYYFTDVAIPGFKDIFGRALKISKGNGLSCRDHSLSQFSPLSILSLLCLLHEFARRDGCPSCNSPILRCGCFRYVFLFLLVLH